MVKPFSVQIDRIRYEVPAISSDEIKQHIEKNLRPEWTRNAGGNEKELEQNERVLDAMNRADWLLEIIPLGSAFLDPRDLNRPAFAKDVAERTAYQSHKLDEGIPIEPIIAVCTHVYDVCDGFHRVLALKAKGEMFVLAYVGRSTYLSLL
jgi:hypothetical protein